MTRRLIPYDPDQKNGPGGPKPERPAEQVHYHYYDQRTFVQDGGVPELEAEEEQAAKPLLSPSRKYLLEVIATLAAIGLLIYFTSPTRPKAESASFADAAPVSCLGHWSYAPSLEQAMDVYVTQAGGSDYNVVITKVVASDAANDFQSIAGLSMVKDDTTVEGTVTKAILHDARRENTLECRVGGAQLVYQGQTRLLKHADADLKSVVAANGWQWPQALDPNKVVASACEGYWVLDRSEGSIAISVERKDNFYQVSLLTQRTADSTEKLIATSGDANHITVQWPDGAFGMTCSPQGAGATLGDGGPATVMTRLSARRYQRLLLEWMYLNDANNASEPDSNALDATE